jgi:hypothetical protein
MKDNLIYDLEYLFSELVDYRSRLLHHLNTADTTDELDEDTICDLRNIRSSLSYVEDQITEIKDRINKRVYCVQVTSNVEMTSKCSPRMKTMHSNGLAMLLRTGYARHSAESMTAITTAPVMFLAMNQ